MLTVIDRLLNQWRPAKPIQAPAPAPLPKAPRKRRTAERFACPSCGRITAHTAAGVPYLHRCAAPAPAAVVLDARAVDLDLVGHVTPHDPAGSEFSVVPPWGDTERAS